MVESSAATSTLPTTSILPATSTTTDVATTITSEPAPIVPGYFRYSYGSAAELPQFPPVVVGYTPYLTPFKGEVRVFESDSGFATPFEFLGQMNNCADAFWVARWASENPDVAILATNEVPFGFDGELVEVEPWLLPPAAAFGVMGGFICTTPGFSFGSAGRGAGNLGDVNVEWQYYDIDPFSGAPAATPNPAGDSCSSYAYDSELPISVCSQGFSVELFQQALGLPVDGYFGPSTKQAVQEFQAAAGLPVTGTMDAATWIALGVTSAAPFPDLNGDGAIDGSEFPFD